MAGVSCRDSNKLATVDISTCGVTALSRLVHGFDSRTRCNCSPWVDCTRLKGEGKRGIIPPRVKYWERWLSPDLLARRYKHCLFSIVVKRWVCATVGRNSGDSYTEIALVGSLGDRSSQPRILPLYQGNLALARAYCIGLVSSTGRLSALSCAGRAWFGSSYPT